MSKGKSRVRRPRAKQHQSRRKTLLGLVAALAIVAGCARIRGSSNSDSVTTTVSASRAQALEIARTQLVHHGFTVTGAGSDVLVTTPKLVPNYLREVSTAKQPSSQRWFLVVQGSDVRFFRVANESPKFHTKEGHHDSPRQLDHTPLREP